MLRLFSKPKPEPQGPRPRAARDAIACTATLCDGQKFHRAQLCDVSKSGCKVRVAAPLQAGQKVQIALEAYHSLGGTIRWCREGMAGIEFVRPMSEAGLLTWRNALGKTRAQAEFAPPGRRKNFLGEWVQDSNRPTLREACRSQKPAEAGGETEAEQDDEAAARVWAAPEDAAVCGEGEGEGAAGPADD